MSYESDSRALDGEILGVIERWHATGERLPDEAFNNLSLRLFEYQLRHNEPYAGYCRRLGVTAAPTSWEQIPAVPAPAFKDAALTTFAPENAALVFHTSGTTTGLPGRHYMETAELYEAALLAGFDRFVLSDGARLHYLNLVPNPAENPRSSLGYMMNRVAERRGSGPIGWYVRRDELLVADFQSDLRSAVAAAQPVCLAATAFALVHLLNEMQVEETPLPPGSRIMETGGFKGRGGAVDRDELYARLARMFKLGPEAIFSEYGMTELTSQYYAHGAARRFAAPPWLRVRVVGPERTTLPIGEVGSLLHVDLANRSSCIAVQTEDMGVMTRDGLLLLGRDREASLRGCSLDAEALKFERLKAKS
jgi:Acyl-protein synthetase, LuxE